MIKQLRLLMQRVTFLIFILFLASSRAAAESELVPPYYAADIQREESPPAAIDFAENNSLQLQNQLPLYQNAATHEWIIIPDTIKFKKGKRNLYVSIVRERLHLMGDLAYNNGSDIFDSELKEAVENFQERHGLKVDGVIGKQTRAELNVTPQERIRQIQINIRRWAGLSHRLGSRYIMVNVPDFELYVIEDNHQILSMKTVVGRPSRQTPELYSKITRLVFKPYWNVPVKIARKDIVRKAIEDPDYLDKNNIRVYDDGEYRFRINDDEVNWQRAARDDGSRYHFRQEPGENNSLGLVKFEIPNSHDVYLHDTPAKNLFSVDKRDFSSGCIRLEKPFDLVNYLMQDDPEWTEEKMSEMLIEDKPTYIRIKKPIPVIITYLTAWVDGNGKINFRDDIYGRDGGTFALKTEEEEEVPDH